MCGITGFWSGHDRFGGDTENLVRSMTAKLSHRGPDAAGIWSDSQKGLALGHQRLAIQDLSPAGKQPMQSNSGRYVIVYNGEIYNARKLRDELEKNSLVPHGWKGHSDTEVLLASVEAWGLKNAVSRFVGMFAFALWDKVEGVLHLVRDRLGIKPLYYGKSGNTFLFASELKSLKEHPDFVGEIDRNVLALFFRHNYIPAPYAIYKNFRKLEPGTILSLPAPDASTETDTYWNTWENIHSAQSSPFSGSYEEAIEELEVLLSDSIKLRMLSDVPLGAFLSGGIDSSLVVALMQKQSSRPVRTFSIGFEEARYDEAPFARKIATHIGTKHTEMYVTSKDAMGVISRIPEIYDEPFADSSQLPTILLSELTRKHVTVALSGDGGDELFGGYNRYRLADMRLNRVRKFPGFLKFALQHLIRAMPKQILDALYKPSSAFLPKALRMSNPGRSLHALAQFMRTSDEKEFYLNMISYFEDPSLIVKGVGEPETKLTQTAQPAGLSFREWMMAQDLVSYLPDDILTKVDRASMAVSLEVRVPILDHRIVEFSWTLPKEIQLKKNQSKWILRQVLKKYMPEKLFNRPKMGFGIPLDSWLRKDLKNWASHLLSDEVFNKYELLKKDDIQLMWGQHQRNEKNWQYPIWNVLMLHSWAEEYL